MNVEQEIRLTQFSHGAGCGCKISPSVLESILHTDQVHTVFPQLLVGNQSKDDAAVFDLGDGTCIISTTDFFMPIVDDPFTFGAIASVNAISDVFAMGGEPIMAIAILGWPVNKIPPEVAKGVLEGSRHVCNKTEIPLAGGHSIDSPEPIFGLAVTGRVRKENLKRNDTAHAGSSLYLTKPLGIGIVTTAQKKGVVKADDLQQAVDLMMTLNWLGEKMGELPYVSAMTDVTGFGLLGHLTEICEGSNLSAVIEYEKVPRLPFLDHYLELKCFPGGTQRNWDSYGCKISPISDDKRFILADPQTSGGLLICVDSDRTKEFESYTQSLGFNLHSFGTLTEKGEHTILVK